MADEHLRPLFQRVRTVSRLSRYGAVEFRNSRVRISQQMLRDTSVDVRAGEVGVTLNGAVEGGDSFIQPFHVQQ